MMKITTYFSTLIFYAKELAKAEKSGDKIRIKEAQEKHDAYRVWCLKSNTMVIGCTNQVL